MGMKEKLFFFNLINYLLIRSGCKEGKKRVHCRACHGQGKLIYRVSFSAFRPWII